MKPKNYFCAAMCMLCILSAVVIIYCGEKFWGIVLLLYFMLGFYFNTFEIMLKEKRLKQASETNSIRSIDRDKSAKRVAYEKYMTFFCSLKMPIKVESVYELPDIPDGINIVSSNDTIAYNVWIADKKLVLCRFIAYGINFDTKQANDPKYIDTMIDAGNLVTRIELCDVVHYKLEGQLEKEYKISGGGGGEISVVGAITGKMMFGNTGAIIGSRTPIEPVKSKLIKHDTRVVVLTYVEGDVEKERYFRPEALNAFDNLMMEKNCEVIKEIKRKKIISTAIGDTVPTKVEEGKKYFDKGVEAYNRKDYLQAIVDYSHAIKLQPEYAEAYNCRGFAYFQKGQYADAKANFFEAIKLKPDFPEAYNNRGDAYTKEGQYDLAIADYSQAIKLQPDYVVAYFSRGESYFQLSEYHHASNDFTRVIELKPDYAESYFRRGLVGNHLKLYDAALADFSRSIELKPDNAHVYAHRGNVNAFLNQYEKAISDYSQALAIQPDYAEVYFCRGLTNDTCGEFTQAIADFTQAINIKPDYYAAYYYRGNAYSDTSQYDNAILDYSQTIKLKSNHVDAYYRRGLALYHQNKYDVAIVDFNQVINLKPEYADAYYSRGNSYDIQGQHEKAVADWLVVRGIDYDLFDQLSEENKASCDEAIYYDSETEQSLASKQDDHAAVYVRYNSKIVYDFLVENGGGVCDECLSELTGITPSQQINLICRKLTKRQIIYRSVKKSLCSVCGSRKLLNSSEVIDNVESDSSSISNGISSGSAVDMHMSKIFEYLEKNEGSSFCDECLARVIGIHQSAVNPMCRTMAEEELINRSTTRGMCSECQSKRILNTFYDEANDPGLVSDVVDIDYSDSQKHYETTQIDETNCSSVAPSTTVAISITPKDADKCHKIFLISCVKEKRKTVTKAKDMYISDYFKKMWEYAQLQKPDKIFILSAKYGLLSPDDEIAPYEVTLKKMTDREVALWSQNVLDKLRTICDLERDSFTVLAGNTYHKYISRYLKNVEIPMDGLTFGRCLQWLKGKISKGGTCEQIHRCLSKLPKYRYPFDLAGIPFHQNGVYVLYQAGEFAHGGDRIVRVGSHSGQDNLIKRLTEHFVVENKDRSIFRKNIGRCLLNKADSDYLPIWEIDNTTSFLNQENSDKRNLEFEKSLEKDISTILRQQFSFVIIPVPSNTCLEVEKKLIATVNECNVCKVSASWLGKYSNKTRIARGKLWQEQHLFGQAFASYDEFLKLTNVG